MVSLLLWWHLKWHLDFKLKIRSSFHSLTSKIYSWKVPFRYLVQSLHRPAESHPEEQLWLVWLRQCFYLITKIICQNIKSFYFPQNLSWVLLLKLEPWQYWVWIPTRNQLELGFNESSCLPLGFSCGLRLPQHSLLSIISLTSRSYNFYLSSHMKLLFSHTCLAHLWYLPGPC